jgi:hypothetical protein
MLGGQAGEFIMPDSAGYVGVAGRMVLAATGNLEVGDV